VFSQLGKHFFGSVAALQPFVAPLDVRLARTQIVKLQAAEPAVVQLAAHDLMKKVEKSAAHAINLVHALHRGYVLITAFRTLRKARQTPARSERNIVSGATPLTTISLQITQPVNEAALGTTETTAALTTSQTVHGFRESSDTVLILR